MLLGVLTLTSCKKDVLVCECSLTVSDGSGNVKSSKVYKITVKNQTRKQAKRGECGSYRIVTTSETEVKSCDIISEYN